jgi:hypothetical protein
MKSINKKNNKKSFTYPILVFTVWKIWEKITSSHDGGPRIPKTMLLR